MPTGDGNHPVQHRSVPDTMPSQRVVELDGMRLCKQPCDVAPIGIRDATCCILVGLPLTRLRPRPCSTLAQMVGGAQALITAGGGPCQRLPTCHTLTSRRDVRAAHDMVAVVLGTVWQRNPDARTHSHQARHKRWQMPRSLRGGRVHAFIREFVCFPLPE